MTNENATQINKIYDYMNHYCPTWTNTSNPVVSAVIRDNNCYYYIFSYDAYYKTMDALIYDCDDDLYTRDTQLYIERIYEYEPHIIEEDEMIGARLTELCTSLGMMCTFGDWNLTRNIEDIKQLHMALKLNIAYAQKTSDPICQAHIRTVDWQYEYFIYGYRHDQSIIEYSEYDRGNGVFTYKTTRLLIFFNEHKDYEIVGRFQYLGQEIKEIKEDMEHGI